MCSSSKIGVDGLEFCLDIVWKVVERFEGWFVTDGSEVRLIENGVLVINIACLGG